MLPSTTPISDKRSRITLLGVGPGLAIVVFLVFCGLWVRWQAASPGVSKISGDFVSFWTAGRLALAGHAADAYREAPHMAVQVALHGTADWGYLAFFYPPPFLVLCAAFALIGYLPALTLWLLTTCAGYAAVLRGMLRDVSHAGQHAWVLFLGYPAVMVNVGFGQNGFLSGALLGGATLWLDRQPILAGICFGCLSYKPQLGLIVPLGLIAAGRWRCVFSAGVTVLTLATAATAVFGADIWPAFLANMADARRWMQVADPDYLAKWITVYGAIRLHNGPLVLAYTAQAMVSVAAALLLVRTLRRRPANTRSGEPEGAAIIACVPFCSPFMLEYDLVILAVPMAWLLREGLRSGFQRGERAALWAAYFAPALFKISAFDNALKLGVIAGAAMLFAAVLRRIGKATVPHLPSAPAS